MFKMAAPVDLSKNDQESGEVNLLDESDIQLQTSAMENVSLLDQDFARPADNPPADDGLDQYFSMPADATSGDAGTFFNSVAVDPFAKLSEPNSGAIDDLFSTPETGPIAQHNESGDVFQELSTSITSSEQTKSDHQSLSNYFQGSDDEKSFLSSSTPAALFQTDPGNIFGFSVGSISDDPFSQIINQSEIERRHDAWIPCENTRELLRAKSQGVPSTLEAQLTTPTIILEENLEDPINDLMKQLSIDGTQLRQKVLTATSVQQNVAGLKELTEAGYYRSAVNLTGVLLRMMGQEPGRTAPIAHSSQSLQVWFVRLSLLVKLRQFSVADAEAQAFGDLDNPDMFYEFYPEVYGPRKGSMAPFSFRLLLAELPQYLGRPQEAMDRLERFRGLIKQILENLSNGLSEDGAPLDMLAENREASKELWKKRELQVLYALTNCAIAHKDYNLAMDMLDRLADKDSSNKSGLWSSKGKVLLQVGDMEMAKKCFSQAEHFATDSVQDKIALCMDKAVLSISLNNFREAYNSLYEAQKFDPSNPVLLNNMSVCLLYMGKLKDALTLLESAILQNPALHLHEGILLNLSTLYELESSRSNQKKSKLLEKILPFVGDGFNVSCLKIPQVSTQ